MESLDVAGAVLSLAAVTILTYPILEPEVRRRERILEREAIWLGQARNLRGKLLFRAPTWASHEPAAQVAYYKVDEVDGKLWSAVGPSIMNEATSAAQSLYWTDRKIGACGIIVAVVGASLVVLSFLR